MIRIEAPRLEADIDAARPKWRSRAAAYTFELKRHGTYSNQPLNGKSAPNWSDIKPVYMALQHNKCAYCERPLETAHELDMEHFRPKGAVTPWSGPPTPPANGRPTGYWWLAYDIGNYCVACKPCNSGLKGDHFPIAGSPGNADDDIASLDATEQPLLLFPFGTRDVDPEVMIGWNGITPIPLPSVGTPGRLRAETTINFFDLGREMLDRQRATEILVLWRWLDVETDPARPIAERNTARATANRHLSSSKKAMRACLRAFAALARRDRAAVLPLVDALDLLVSPGI